MQKSKQMCENDYTYHHSRDIVSNLAHQQIRFASTFDVSCKDLNALRSRCYFPSNQATDFVLMTFNRL